MHLDLHVAITLYAKHVLAGTLQQAGGAMKITHGLLSTMSSGLSVQVRQKYFIRRIRGLTCHSSSPSHSSSASSHPSSDTMDIAQRMAQLFVRAIDARSNGTAAQLWHQPLPVSIAVSLAPLKMSSRGLRLLFQGIIWHLAIQRHCCAAVASNSACEGCGESGARCR